MQRMARRSFLKSGMLATSSILAAPIAGGVEAMVGKSDQRKALLFLPIPLSQSVQDELFHNPFKGSSLIREFLGNGTESLGIKVELIDPSPTTRHYHFNEAFKFKMEHSPLLSTSDAWEFLFPLTIIANFVGSDLAMSMVAPARLNISADSHVTIQKAREVWDLQNDNEAALYVFLSQWPRCFNHASNSLCCFEVSYYGFWEGSHADFKESLTWDSNKLQPKEMWAELATNPLNMLSLWG